ncbi:hypothetical protein GXN80_18140 [Serratia marcescens]|nr:hypothetical protein [Serratia marcescens]
MHKVSSLFIFISLIILIIAFSLNLYGHYATSNSNAVPLFSPLWWTRWFPLYASGATLLLIGLVLRVSGRGR